MAPSQRVRAGEGDDLPVGEAHAVEDVAEVLSSEGRVGEPADSGACRGGLGVASAKLELDRRTTEGLDRDAALKRSRRSGKKGTRGCGSAQARKRVSK